MSTHKVPIIAVALLGLLLVLIHPAIALAQTELTVDLGPNEYIRTLDLVVNQAITLNVSNNETWLTVTPGTIDAIANEPFQLTLVVDRFDLPQGDYVDIVTLQSQREPLTIEVRMSVGVFDLPASDFGRVAQNSMATYDLEIEKISVQKLWRLVEAPPWITSVSPDSGTLEPGSGLITLPLSIEFTSDLEYGTYEGELVFSSSAGYGVVPISAILGTLPTPSVLNVTIGDRFAHYSDQGIFGVFNAVMLQLPQMVTVDIVVDFEVANPESVEQAYLIISGERQRSKKLDKIARSDGYRLEYQQIIATDVANGFLDILLEIIQAIAKVPGTGGMVTGEYPIYDGKLDSLVLVDVDGNEHVHPIDQELITVYGHLFNGLSRATGVSLGGGTYAVQTLSPVDIIVTDSQGRQTGMTNEGPKADIPFSIYTGPETEEEYIIIFSVSEEEFTVEIIGTDDGQYGLDRAYISEDLQNGQLVSLRDRSIEIGKIDTYEDMVQADNAELQTGGTSISDEIDGIYEPDKLPVSQPQSGARTGTFLIAGIGLLVIVAILVFAIKKRR